MINNLSADLNIMRPSMLETGLESISWNINRKNSDLRFFEFGKTYENSQPGKYAEINHCCLYTTGNLQHESWKGKAVPADFYYIKGVCTAICELTGIKGEIQSLNHPKLVAGIEIRQGEKIIFVAGEVDAAILRKFDIRQPVFFTDIYWDNLLDIITGNSVVFSELSKQVPVNRDLALIVEKSLPFETIEKTVFSIGFTEIA